MTTEEDRIVLTPLKKAVKETVMKLERIKSNQLNSKQIIHEGGGHNKGIIVNREVDTNSIDYESMVPDVSLSFKVYLVNSQTGKHAKEIRLLRFWFQENINTMDCNNYAQSFFRNLVNPSDFPRNYVGFIMKIMKLMQNTFPLINQIIIDLKQFDDDESIDLPSRPVSVDEKSLEAKNILTIQNVLDLIEKFYPNAVSLLQITESTNANEEEVYYIIQELLAKGLIKTMDNNLFIRIVENDSEVKMVKQMPKVNKSQQPTIAIITAQFTEKLAVDAMIENKNTYVKYKTEGESNVYTLGNIGWHRVVSTKLPSIGHSRQAMIAAGNTTTRLLGTFQHIDYVFLVGVGGGVPHFTDYRSHVRLGDVVVSTIPDTFTQINYPSPPASPSPAESSNINKPYIYINLERNRGSNEDQANNLESTTEDTEKQVEDSCLDKITFKTWCPEDFELQEVAECIWKNGYDNYDNRLWEKYIDDGRVKLSEQDLDFTQPNIETDKLFMPIGNKDVIEIKHPETPEDEYDPRKQGYPKIHFGAVGSGRSIVKDERCRQEVANKYGVLSFDSDEFCTVAESIHGNRKDKYIFIRGISDYKDGTRRKEWQPTAALNAAAFMKAVIMTLSPADD